MTKGAEIIVNVVDEISVADAAQCLVIDKLESQMWFKDYNIVVEYDQVNVFFADENILNIVFHDDCATVRYEVFEYADPTFDDQVVGAVERLLYI